MKIVVTDLTRFSNKDIVCLAGIDPDSGRCIRPMVQQGARLEYFSFESIKAAKVIPGSVLEGDFVAISAPTKPHVEDCAANGKVHVVESATGEEFRRVLELTACDSIESGFGALPTQRLFPHNNPPKTSIITLRLRDPSTQFKMIVDKRFGAPKFKAHITDADGTQLSWTPVTDLGFADHLNAVVAKDPQLVKLNQFLWAQDVLYIRLGLSRCYEDPNGRNGFWMQLNGIYSFPNFRNDLRAYE